MSTKPSAETLPGVTPCERSPRSDDEGHLTFSGRQLDLEGLFKEGAEPGA